MTRRQVWQGGVCEGLAVDSPEASERLRAVYGSSVDLQHALGEESTRELTDDEKRQWEEENLDFFDWLMKG